MPVLNSIEAERQIHEPRPSIKFRALLNVSGQPTSVHRMRGGITSVLSKSNVGHVIKGVEAGLHGKPFAEARI
jgi:hypothetical protein